MNIEEQKDKFTYYCDYYKVGTLSKAQYDRYVFF